MTETDRSLAEARLKARYADMPDGWWTSGPTYERMVRAEIRRVQRERAFGELKAGVVQAVGPMTTSLRRFLRSRRSP